MEAESLKQLEDLVIVVKYIYPLMSGAFIIIITLILYIWKSDNARRDENQVETNKILSGVVDLTTRLDERVKNLEKK